VQAPHATISHAHPVINRVPPALPHSVSTVDGSLHLEHVEPKMVTGHSVPIPGTQRDLNTFNMPLCDTTLSSQQARPRAAAVLMPMSASCADDEQVSVSSWYTDCSDMNSCAASVRITRRLLLEAAALSDLSIPDLLSPCSVEPSVRTQQWPLSSDGVSEISRVATTPVACDMAHRVTAVSDQKFVFESSSAHRGCVAWSADVPELTAGHLATSTCTDSSNPAYQSCRERLGSAYPGAVLPVPAVRPVQVVSDSLPDFPYPLLFSPATPRLFRSRGEPLLRYHEMSTPSHATRGHSSFKRPAEDA